MLLNTITFTVLAIRGVAAQITYSACRNETVGGNVLYGCLGPAGTRTVFDTYAAVTGAPATTTVTVTAGGEQTTAVTGCHTHSGTAGVFCTNGAGTEVSVAATPTGEAPAAYSGCHEHGPGET
jgi:zinc transporter 1/2/3